MTFEWVSWVGFAAAVGIAVLAMLLLAGASALAVRWIAPRHPGFAASYRAPRTRLLVLVAVILLQVAVATTWPHADSRQIVRHVLLILSIAAAAWALSAVLAAAVARIRARHPIDIEDNRNARRIHTQLAVLHGLGTVLIAIIAAGAAFFTIPGAEVVGTSLLASAGVASVVAGIAAQAVLGNVFAGIQLAFSGAIRVDDVVVANGEWGRIEEITLTSIVLKVWDERRVVLPSTYFTTTPFENWTRDSTEILGTVRFDVDWRVSPAAMRAKLDEILRASPLWDGRASGIVVEDATGGTVRMRALISARNSSDQWDLRCLVRERIVEWLASDAPAALPASRVVVEAPNPPDTGH